MKKADLDLLVCPYTDTKPVWDRILFIYPATNEISFGATRSTISEKHYLKHYYHYLLFPTCLSRIFHKNCYLFLIRILSEALYMGNRMPLQTVRIAVSTTSVFSIHGAEEIFNS